MFSFFKKKNAGFSPDYFPFVTDIHSHILPGIDDGSPDVDTSIKLIKGLVQLGVQQSIATPHIIGDMYRNDAASIQHALSILRNELKTRQIDFQINAAAEYMLDGFFLDLLSSKIPLLTLKDNLVLTEFSYADKPYNIEQIVFSIITEGYQPILAHPERYAYFHNDLKQYKILSDMGFLLQVNLLSLTGYYGKQVTKAAYYIVQNNLIAFTGSDLHHARHLEALADSKNKMQIAKILDGKMYNQELRF